jgi:hypothetical protein
LNGKLNKEYVPVKDDAGNYKERQIIGNNKILEEGKKALEKREKEKEKLDKIMNFSKSIRFKESNARVHAMPSRRLSQMKNSTMSGMITPGGRRDSSFSNVDQNSNSP